MGSADVNITATEIGSDYNLEVNEQLRVGDESESQIYAKVIEEVDGGSSETVKVVSEEDLETAKIKIQENMPQEITNEIKKVVSSTQKLINGSEETQLVEEAFSHEVDEETDKLNLTQNLSLSALVYIDEEMQNLMDDMVKEFVPTDYELSDKDKELTVEVLGNTTNTILNSSEADLQVTLKSYVLPQINEEELKSQLVGTNQEEASRILSGVRNVQNYELNITPFLPFFNKVPTNLDQILIEVQRQ